MWETIGGIIVGVFKSGVGAFFEWRERRKMSREASKGRAAAEYLKSQDEARAKEEAQRAEQERIKKEDGELNKDNVFEV